MRRQLIPMLTASGMLAVAIALAGSASAQNLGGVDEGKIREWCGHKLGLNVLAAAGPSDLYNAYSWKCGRTPWIWDGGGVDMNAVCTMQYGSPAYAYTDNPHWAHSWNCRR